MTKRKGFSDEPTDLLGMSDEIPEDAETPTEVETETPAPSNRKVWRTIQNIALWYPAKVTGQVLFTPTGHVRPANGEEIVPKYKEGDTPPWIVLSGSVIEIELPIHHEARWLRIGAIAPMESNLHVDLENVFGPDKAKLLRMNGIFTYEDIVNERMVDPAPYSMLGLDNQVPMRSFLTTIVPAEEVDGIIEQARRIVKTPERE